MRRCAFLTMESLDGFVSDDELLVEPMARAGWTVEMVPWRRSGVDWSRFDAVLVRTTWDYPDEPHAFLRVLERIHRSRALLLNPLELLRWNLEKTYLLELGTRDVPVVPTVVGRELTREGVGRLRRALDAERLVVKPVIGANASRLHCLEPGDAAAEDRAIRELGDRKYLAQPFLSGVVREGEYSLFYFGGEHSHSILKSPTGDDFRVQEEHGGRIRAVRPGPGVVSVARRAVDAVTPEPLYARVDLVDLGEGSYAVMELELVEPALYFRTDPSAAERFVEAFRTRVEKEAKGSGGVGAARGPVPEAGAGAGSGP